MRQRSTESSAVSSTTSMAQEERSQKLSRSSGSDGGADGGAGGSGCGGGGSNPEKPSSSLKQKPKKVPQRGLGVAQLERIRKMEEQKKDMVLSAVPDFSCIVVPENFHNPSVHSAQASLLACKKLSVSSEAQVQNHDPYMAIPLMTHHHQVRPASGTSQVSIADLNVIMRGCCDHHTEKQCSGSGLGSDINLMPSPSVVPMYCPPWDPTTQPWYPPPMVDDKRPLMVGLSPVTSLPPSPPTLQQAPSLHPAVQCYYNYLTPILPQQDKAGVQPPSIKRPYGFYPEDNPPGPSFHRSTPPSPLHVHKKSKEAAASGCMGCPLAFHAGKPNYSEGLCWAQFAEPNLWSNTKANADLKRDFLRLAPPEGSAYTSSMLKAKSAADDGRPSSAFKARAEQNFIDEPVHQMQQLQKPYYNFLQSSMEKNGQARSDLESDDGEANEDGVDLILKL